MDQHEWVVERVVDYRLPTRNWRTWEFRVHWEGFSYDEDSWLPWPEVRNLEALDTYLDAHPELAAFDRRLRSMRDAPAAD